MARLRVWAPNANSVEVALDASQIAMEREGGGWWAVESAAVRDGAEYAFLVDGGDALPDPRSPRQPHGVHGRSQLVDHGAFAWSDSTWQPPPLDRAVLYELHVGTFSPEGTFDGVARRLDHLVRLGATHIELMPIASFCGVRGWGYDGVDLFAPHEPYGGPVALKRLVDACHAHGLAVLVDVVYNHLGPEGNYLGRFGPYFTDRYVTPWGAALNFDGAESDEVRRFCLDNARMWLRDYHADGLRIDAIHGIVDTSAVHFLEELAEAASELERELGRPLLLIAESDLNDPRFVTPRELGGCGIDAQWNDDFHHALHALITGERSGYYADFGSLADCARALEQTFVYGRRYSAFRRRRHGREVHGLSALRFVGFLQNHDQIGSRCDGARVHRLAGEELVRVAAALVFTAPFVPLVFQGEEWAASSPFLYFTDHRAPAVVRAVRDGRRRELVERGLAPDEAPDPQAEETFARSRLNWDELAREPHRSCFNWYQRLARLRREHAELRDGLIDRGRVQFDERARWLTLQRGPLLIACNFAATDVAVPLHGGAAPAPLAASEPGCRVEGAVLHLAPKSVAVLRCQA
jgi:maltooligosyltrehalose trehalohydrolase